MGGITGSSAEGLATVTTTATSNAVASNAEAGNGGRLVAIKQGRKLVIKRSFSAIPIGPRTGEPDRPLRPTAQKAFGPSLYSDLARCYTWSEWAESYMQEVRKEHQQKLQTAQTGHFEAVTKESDKRMHEAITKLASLEKREKDLKAAQAKTKREQAELKTYQDLSDAIQHLGDKTEKAVREMRTLTAGKSRPQQAFDPWEKVYCEPSIRLVDLNRQVRTDRDETRQRYDEQMKSLQGREEHVSRLTVQQVVGLALLAEQRRDLAAEQEEWRLQRGRELSDSEQKDIMEDWIERKIEELKPAMLADARKCNWAIHEMEWDSYKAKEIAKSRAEGYAQGKKDGHELGLSVGYMKGKKDALEVLRKAKAEAKSEGYAEGYDEGKAFGEKEGMAEGYAEGWTFGKSEGYIDGYKNVIAAGHSQGHQKGHAKGRAEALAEGTVNYDKGHHDGRQEGYVEGRTAGKSEGHSEGRMEGYAQGLAAGKAHGDATRAYTQGVATGKVLGHSEGHKEAKSQLTESFYRGFHTSVFASSNSLAPILLPVGTPNKSHPYWWGRALADVVRRQGLLSDPKSSWYGADKDVRHPLSLRSYETQLYSPISYHTGVWDGIFRPTDPTIPVPGWSIFTPIALQFST